MTALRMFHVVGFCLLALPSIGLAEEKPKIERALIVFTADSAHCCDDSGGGPLLTLDGVDTSAVVFVDRPSRAVGITLLVDLLKNWGGLAFGPPFRRASVAAFSKDGVEEVVREEVLFLQKVDGDKLTFAIFKGSGLSGEYGATTVSFDNVEIEENLFPFIYWPIDLNWPRPPFLNR